MAKLICSSIASLDGYSYRVHPLNEEEDLAESRGRSWAFAAAFSLIIIFTIIDGLTYEFEVGDWATLVVAAVFLGQSLLSLSRPGDAP